MSDEEFISKHDADPRSVYLVVLLPENRAAVFSTLEKANAWIETQPENAALVTTRIIDEPEYGNATEN